MADPAAPAPAPEPDARETDGRSARIRARVDSVRTRAEETRHRLDEIRPRSKALDVAWSTLEYDLATGGGVLAGAVAFRVFMFIVPYVFVLVAGLGFAADAADQSSREVARSAGIGGLAAQAIVGVSSASNGERITVLVLGGFALLLAARTAVKVLNAVHALVWQVPIRRVRHSARAALVFVLVVTVALGLVSLVGRVRAESTIAGLIVLALYTAVPAGMWLTVSWFMPRAEGSSWFDLLPGAVLFAFGTQLLHVFTVLWVARQVSSKTETYGAIGAALALLLWAFLLGRIMTASAALNAILWQRAHPGAAPGDGVRRPVPPPMY